MYNEQLQPQRRSELLAQATPEYINLLREDLKERYGQVQALTAADKIQFLSDEAIPALLTGNVITEDGRPAYAGAFGGNLDIDAASSWQQLNNQTTKRTAARLIPLGLIIITILFFSLRSVLGSDEEAIRLPLGENVGCSEEIDAYGSKNQDNQPRTIEIVAERGSAAEQAADAGRFFFCVVNIEPDRNGILKEFPTVASLQNNVAWLTNSVMRPVFGVAPELLERIQSGDSVMIRQDSQTRHYLINGLYEADKSQAAELFDQTQPPGVILFSLDSDTDSNTVVVAQGIYQERTLFPQSFQVSQAIELEAATLRITQVNVAQLPSRTLEVQVEGVVQGNAQGDTNSIVTLQLQNEAGTAYQDVDQSGTLLVTAAEKTFQTTFLLPDEALSGTALRLSSQPNEIPAFISLDLVRPTLQPQLLDVKWDGVAREVVLTIGISSEGQAALHADMVKIQQQGGELPLWSDREYPLIINDTDLTSVEYRFRPVAASAIVLFDGRQWAQLDNLPHSQ